MSLFRGMYVNKWRMQKEVTNGGGVNYAWTDKGDMKDRMM